MTVKTLIITGLVVKEHDYSRTNLLLKQMLESTGMFSVKINEEFRGCTEETLQDYDLIIFNYDGKEWILDEHFTYWGETAENAIYHFVKSGKGAVFYHSSVAVGAETPLEYKRMLGCYVERNGRRNPQPDFLITNTDNNHPITKGLKKNWYAVNDDLLVGIDYAPEHKVEILATAFDSVDEYKNTGFPPKHFKVKIPEGDLNKMHGVNTHQPVAWTNLYGEGRTFSISVGHDIDTMRRETFLAMFVRGAEWAATGKVTIPKPDRTGENRLKPWPFYSK
ncbi:ThuA domain-containing protein [Metabacillus endolithicus]|uniref:ThuA domain-containing protein n=1 Tax=Metabacillus endolithicus TaxID=1535204 RepID=A0ABW5BZY6_9BACI|nr:ThuA domain-containing protein [Metabacillus endolithicus]UPG62601.1 ThuA domain-containing protein [Metabacillus endolithicus]